VTGASKNLSFVPFEHVDHPFPRCLMQRVCHGQSFRGSVARISGKVGVRVPEPAPTGVGNLDHAELAMDAWRHDSSTLGDWNGGAGAAADGHSDNS
jgi:hypothetical protein